MPAKHLISAGSSDNVLSLTYQCAQPTIGEVICGIALFAAISVAILGLIVFLTVGIWLIVR